MQGEGAIHAPASRAVRGLVVDVTDETGAPAAHATVNFRVPDEGSTAVFGNGLRTDLTTTDEAGRAAMPTLQFNNVPGEFRIQITAARGAARASMVSTQYISAGTVAAHQRGRWVAAGLAIAGGAGAALAVMERGGAHAAAPSDSGTLSIGTPAIAIGKPK